jgi:hypothetical protein
MKNSSPANLTWQFLRRYFIQGATALGCLIGAQQAIAADAPHKTLNLLYSIQGNYTLAGQHNKEPNANPLYYSTGVNTRTGKWPALHSGDFLFGATDINNRQTMINQIIEQWNAGAVINLMWHACSPAGTAACQWEGGVKTVLTNTQWTDLITDGTALNNTWKQRMDDVAVFLQQLEDAGVEVMFRPLHEMNQGVFWWGGRKGPEGTARLYQITHDYFTKTKGLSNLIWVWNLQDFSTLATDVDDYDPGNEYWDVLSLDMYWSDGKGYETSKYEAIRNKAAGKPIAIGEAEDLPSPNLLRAQPDWTFFMGWAELTFNNSNDKLNEIYSSDRVLTRDELSGWDNYSFQVTQAEDFHNMDGGEVVDSAEEGGQVLSGIDAWEWVSYPEFEVAEDGVYTLALRVKTSSMVTMQIEEAGVGALATLQLPALSGQWSTIYKTLELSKGTHAFGFKSTEGTFDLNWYTLSGIHEIGGGSSSSSSSSSVSSSSAPATGGSYPIVIEAESYSNMDGVIKSTDVDGESTSIVSSFGAWEWMSYPEIVLPSGGDHVISYRVKSTSATVLQLEEAGTGVHGTLNFPSTGGSWATVTHTVPLSAGAHAFGLKVISGDISINWFSVDCVSCAASSSSQSSSSEPVSSASSAPSSAADSSSSVASSATSSADASSASSQVAESSSSVASSTSSHQSSAKKSSGGGSSSAAFLALMFMLSVLSCAIRFAKNES